MATVTSQLTRIHDAEGALTTANLPAGGAGATANTDIFLQGSQSLGRRQTNTSDTGGFLLVDGADNDCSAADVHVGIWFWVTHFGILDDLRLILATGTGTPTNYDSHSFALSEYPKKGGWVRAWIDVSRTPEVAGGTGLNEAQLRSYGIQISFTTAPGGNAQNLILDAADFTNGGAALQLTGVIGTGLWSDFSSDDEANANQYGVFFVVGGAFSCFARVQLGTSGSPLIFNDSNFTINFPQQNLVHDTFMGVTCNLQHASTSIAWTNGTIKSVGTKKGDVVVVGTSGTLSASSVTFDRLRVLTLTSGCTLTTCFVQASGQITQAGATVTGCRIASSTAAVAVLSNAPNLISDCVFVSAGTGHAIEITTPGTYTFDGNLFNGYAVSNGSTGNEAVYNNSGGAVTLNIVGGGNTPSYRNGAGASTTINSNVSVTLTGIKNPSEVRVYLAGTQTAVAGQEDVTTGSFVFAVGSGIAVDMRILSLAYKMEKILNYSTTSDVSLPVAQQPDPQYNNP